MFDKRVVRGNTYAAQILPAVSDLPTPLVTRPSSDSRESKRAAVLTLVAEQTAALMMMMMMILTRHRLPTGLSVPRD
jgi:hypothetical protein